MKNSCEEVVGIAGLCTLKFTDSGKFLSARRFSGVKCPIAYRQLLSCLSLLMILTLLPLSLAHANDFAAWTDSTSNPLFGGSASGVDRAYYPSVIKVGSVYHIWYGDSVNTRHASSTNFDFNGGTFPAPAVTGLVTTNPYHPRVLYNASGWNIGGTAYAGPFLMYYTDGASWNSTRVAYSADGNSWTDIGLCAGVHSYSGGVIYNFDVLYEGGTTWKAYADNGGGHIEYYISMDGINWTGTAHNILGSLQAWETWFTSPHVIKSGSQYIMYYGSGGPGSNQGIGVAFSTDGQNFTKSSSNPIFSTSGAPGWRDDRTYTPYVIPDGTSWRMYYTGRSSTGAYSIGYALPTSLPPTGSITINSGDATTNSTSVSLTLLCSDSTGCSQMCISNTSTCSSWEIYSPTKPWTLTSGNGTKTVYSWFSNSVGNQTISPYSDSINLSGQNERVDLSHDIYIIFSQVSDLCTSSSSIVGNSYGSAPSGYNFVGNFYDVTTCADYTGTIYVTIPYEQSSVPSGKEGTLRMFHWENGAWHDVTLSVNTADNTITGRVTSLSPFGLGYPYSSGSSGAVGHGTGANENMIAFAILAIFAGIFLLKRYRRFRKV